MTDGLFEDDDIIRLVAREGVLIAAGGTASLLQTAHPGVAQGVYDHSYTAEDPMRRLQHTMGWLYTVQFGTREEAEVIGRYVKRMHDTVTGPGYQANDDELQVWVASTLFAVAVQVYEYIFRRKFTPAELEEFYQQSKVYASNVGTPESAMPDTYADFREYYAHMINTIEISEASRAVAEQVLHPKLPFFFEPGLWMIRLITAGFMPEPLRAQYGWKWNRAREIRFHLLMNAISLTYPRLPLRVRTLPRAVYLHQMRKHLAKMQPGKPKISVRSAAA